VSQEAPYDKPWIFLSDNPDYHTSKTNSSGKICTWKRRNMYFEVSNSELGCTVTALRFFLKKIPPLALWHRAYSDKCFCQVCILELTTASLLESELGFETVTQLANTGKWLIFTSIVCSCGACEARQWTCPRFTSEVCEKIKIHS
jgi:hypothetical protein